LEQSISINLSFLDLSGSNHDCYYKEVQNYILKKRHPDKLPFFCSLQKNEVLKHYKVIQINQTVIFETGFKRLVHYS